MFSKAFFDESLFVGFVCSFRSFWFYFFFHFIKILLIHCKNFTVFFESKIKFDLRSSCFVICWRVGLLNEDFFPIFLSLGISLILVFKKIFKNNFFLKINKNSKLNVFGYLIVGTFRNFHKQFLTTYFLQDVKF